MIAPASGSPYWPKRRCLRMPDRRGSAGLELLAGLVFGVAMFAAGWAVRGGCQPIVVPDSTAAAVKVVKATKLPERLDSVATAAQQTATDIGTSATQTGQQAATLAHTLDSARVHWQATDSLQLSANCRAALWQDVKAIRWYDSVATAAQGGLSKAAADLRLAHDQIASDAFYLWLARDTLDLARNVVTQQSGLIDKARTPKPHHWAAGPIWEVVHFGKDAGLGRLVPVGGFLQREKGRFLAGAEVTDGPVEPLTTRVRLGLTF